MCIRDRRYVTEYYGAENDTAQLSIMEDCIRDYPRAMSVSYTHLDVYKRQDQR